MKNLFLLFLIAICQLAVGQKVKGVILSQEDSSAIPYAQIITMPGHASTLTNENGEFEIEILSIDDTLMILYTGYREFKQPVSTLKKPIKIYLERESINFDEVNIIVEKKKKRIKRKEDPAYILHQKIVENKPTTNYQNNSYKAEIYNKVKIDVNNVSEKTKDVFLFKPIGFLFENIDSTTEKPSVPIFISEGLSDYYHQANPSIDKEIIKGSNISGLSLKSLNQFTGNSYTSFNIYDNYYNILQKSFISPIAELSWLSYKYYITDSLSRNDTTYYQLSFLPIRSADLAFSGSLWVNNIDFAVQSIKLELPKSANINYMNTLTFDFTYKPIDGVYYIFQENVFIDLTVSDGIYGFYIDKRSTYNHLQKIPEIPDEIRKLPQKVVTSDSVSNQDNSYFQDKRTPPLTEEEENRYVMAEKVVKTRYIRNITNLSEMVYTGYYPSKYFEFGPYYTFYSFNTLEGNRFKIGGTSTPDLFKKTQFQGFYAYGSFDKRAKYQVNIRRFLKSEKIWRYIELDYTDKYQLLNASDDAFQEDNILASLSRRVDPRFTHVKRFKASFWYDWRNGISNFIDINFDRYKPLGALVYNTPSSGNLNLIYNNYFSIGGRIALNEKFVYYGFRRFSLSTRKPQIEYRYTKGIKVLNEGLVFDKVMLKFTDRYYVGILGYIDVVATGEKIWGNLPYPLLLNHQGNDSYVYDDRAFNLMYPFEFVSDEYVSLMLTHNFNGLIFNQVPLIKKLKLRSLIFGRATYGTLRSDHKDVVLLPKGLSALSEPYAEAGFGVANIFKVVRVDFLWRLSNIKPTTQRFGINISFKIRL